MRLIEAVLFDFDHTLARLKTPWDELLHTGATKAVRYLRSEGLDLPEDFERMVLDARAFGERKSEEEQEEHNADDTLAFLLQFFGYQHLDEAILKQAVDEFYAPEIAAWELWPDTIETLRQLRARNLYLGIVSNYNLDRGLQRTIDLLGIREYFDMILVSASVEWRKPQAAIFEVFLEHWDLLPYEVVMVGDDLQADIGGAIEAGMMTIQACMLGGANLPDLPGVPKPDAKVRKLAEVVPIIDRWSALDEPPGNGLAIL